jgi:hypothetical protein
MEAACSSETVVTNRQTTGDKYRGDLNVTAAYGFLDATLN